MVCQLIDKALDKNKESNKVGAVFSTATMSPTPKKGVNGQLEDVNLNGSGIAGANCSVVRRRTHRRRNHNLTWPRITPRHLKRERGYRCHKANPRLHPRSRSQPIALLEIICEGRFRGT